MEMSSSFVESSPMEESFKCGSENEVKITKITQVEEDSEIKIPSEKQSFRPFKQGVFYQLSTNLLECYTLINQKYMSSLENYKTENESFVINNGDVIRNYQFLEFIGKGSFGSVMKAINLESNTLFAIKIIKKNPLFYKQGIIEIEFLNLIRENDPHDEHGIVRLHEHFEERNHLFLVFEHLSINLFELLQKTQFHGISLDLIRKFAFQILRSLIFLSSINLIHSDLKPENILLCHPQKCALKIIDFGSSCRSHQIIYKYTQSRFYRAPEVLLELSYDVTIDMWSFACILVELYTGDPLFAGLNEEDQLFKISKVLGLPPVEMIAASPKQHVFFVKRNNQFFLKSSPEGEGEGGRRLYSIIKRKKQTDKEEFDIFIDFIERLLKIDPAHRYSPAHCLLHPFFNKPVDKIRKKNFTPERRRTTGKRAANFDPPPRPQKFQRSTQ